MDLPKLKNSYHEKFSTSSLGEKFTQLGLIFFAVSLFLISSFFLVPLLPSLLAQGLFICLLLVPTIAAVSFLFENNSHLFGTDKRITNNVLTYFKVFLENSPEKKQGCSAQMSTLLDTSVITNLQKQLDKASSQKEVSTLLVKAWDLIQQILESFPKITNDKRRKVLSAFQQVFPLSNDFEMYLDLGEEPAVEPPRHFSSPLEEQRGISVTAHSSRNDSVAQEAYPPSPK